MKYFKDINNIVYAYESDGSQDEFIIPDLSPITEKEAMDIANPPPTQDEVIAEAEAKNYSCAPPLMLRLRGGRTLSMRE